MGFNINLKIRKCLHIFVLFGRGTKGMPVDVIDYQKYDANLKNTFVGNYMIVCPAKSKHIEKVMTCQFVDATGTP